MYPAGAASTQAVPQGPAGPTTSPGYSFYQPTPTQGCWVGWEAAPSPYKAPGAPGLSLLPLPPPLRRLWLPRPRRASQPSPSLRSPAPWAPCCFLNVCGFCDYVSFLISLVICIFSYFFLVSWARGVFILFIFFKDTAIGFIDCCYGPNTCIPPKLI